MEELEEKIKKAIEMYKNAIALRPDIANAYILLGNLYCSERKFETAIKLFKKIISIEPANANDFFE